MKKSIIIFTILLFAAGIFYFKFLKKPVLSPQKAADKAIDFINKYMLQGQKASLEKVTAEGENYKITFKINNRENTAYLSRDGKLLFYGFVELDKNPQTAGASEQKEIPKTEKPEVKLFVMSFCPYGNQAEEIIKPVVELLKDNVLIEPRYVIYENYGSGYPEYCLDKENKYCSMHGINELNQDIREICVFKNQKEKFWDFVDTVNKECSVENVETCWQTVASKTGVDVDSIINCQKENGEKFAKEEKALNQKYGVSGSPDLVINGVHYTGQRTPEDFKKAICSAFKKPPEVCKKTLSATTSAASGGCQ